MGSTVKYGLPWPAGTDMIAQGDEAIRSLAEGVEGSLLTVEGARLTANPPTGVAATDGAHIQALIDQVYAANGGGIVHLREGIAYRGNVVLKPHVILYLPPKATLKGADAVTAPVVDGLNFATLTGKAKATGDYLLGCPGAGVVGGGKVDANDAAQFCVRLWGGALRLELEAVNATLDGIHTEFTDVDSFLDSAQVLEGQFGNIVSHDHGRDGWVNRGPHDSVCRGYWCWDNAGWGLTIDAVFSPAAGYNGGTTFDYFNSYLNTLGSCRVLNGGFVDIKSGALSGEGGTGLDLSAMSGGSRARVAVAGHAPGIRLRGLSHKIEITNATDNGYVSATGDVVEIDGANKCEVNIGGGSNNKNVLYFLTSGGPCYFHGTVEIGTGQTFTRGVAPNTQTTILFSANGAGGTFSEVRLPSATLKNPTGYAAVLPASNGTLLTGDLAVFTPVAAVNAVNSALFRDSADGKLKFKDAAGVVNPLY